MDLLAGLGFTDYRFSIEWARIEPERGRVSRAEIAPYRRMVEGALARGLRPMVTLHHFTVPRWFEDLGGWLADNAVELFTRYVEACAPVIADGVRHVCTINEPNMVAVVAAAAKAGDAGSRHGWAAWAEPASCHARHTHGSVRRAAIEPLGTCRSRGRPSDNFRAIAQKWTAVGQPHLACGLPTRREPLGP
jgi:beta-glucosidase/6-phospho-beta-glucosidase/beta-galactosidase